MASIDASDPGALMKFAQISACAATIEKIVRFENFMEVADEEVDQA